MNTNDNQPDLNTVPMSEGEADVTQTMLQTGMLQAPARPGARGAVGRFEILRPLATGGMGQVFLAREPITDGRVAIKMIRPRYRSEEWVVRRFLTEAQHMYRMSHPNILKVMEVSDRKEGPYYVMPFVEGGNLAQAIRPGKPLPEDRILEIARQVAEALQYAHARGIIHRDLKPANVLLDKEGRAYLTDFGLLRTVFNDAIVDPDKSGPEGTAAYMSPLAASGKAEDTRCDIYAFGAVLYEMLTGCKPYEGMNPKAIVDKILAGPPRPILQVKPKAPPALARIAEACMARELRDRYAEMGDVVRDLDRVARRQEALGPHGAPEGHAVMLLTLSGKRSLGKVLAIVGTVLQAATCLAAISWVAILLDSAYRLLGFGPSNFSRTAFELSGNAAMVMLTALSGLFLLAMALAGVRYRAPWFFKAMHIVAALWLLCFPAGTFGALFIFIYLRKHKAEFAVEPAAARPTRSLHLQNAGIILWVFLVIAILAYGFYRIEMKEARLTPSAQSKAPPAATAKGLSAKALCARGWRVWREQRYEEAEKLFQQATEANPKLADAWNGLGWSRQNMGLMQNAKEAFERCVALDPKNAGALNGLGWIAKSEKKVHEAIQYWERAVAAVPQATAALAGLASTHLELGDFGLAEKHARNWLTIEPENTEAQRILTEAQSKLQKTTEQAPPGERKVSLQFREAALWMVTDYYANLTGRSVILSPQVQADRPCTLKSNGPVPVEEAARLIEAYLSACDLKMTPVGENAVRIDPAAQEIRAVLPAKSVAIKSPISLSFREAPLRLVTDFYAELTGQSVILSPQVNADRPCTLKTVSRLPSEEAVRLIEAYLSACDLKMTPVGENAVRIDPAAQEIRAVLPSKPIKSDRQINVDFREAPLRQVANFYADLTGQSVILSPQVNADRPCTLKAVNRLTSEEAARLIEAYLSASDLTITPISDTSVRIDPVQQESKPSAPPAEEEPPRIVSTTPAVGAADIDPATTEITVSFDQDMRGGFSWTGGGPDYPEVTGGPSWRDSRTCVLPVKLEPGRYYRVGINSKSHQNFRSKAGVPTPPSALYFTTRGASDELKARTQKPAILEMTPANGAVNVDPNTTELRVTFSVPMGGGFSWTGGGPEYPAGPEDKGPYWTEDKRTCVRPVRLEPNHTYRLGLNSFSHKNFQSAAGVPLDPVVYTFQTAAGVP